jgi:endogenous inhibitor of DNA gyrase (YacG/DUF329 family)
MTRTCDQCGKHLITHRADARFCGKDCNNAWHNEQRRSGTATDKHLTPVSGGVGSRGGNVRSVDEARILQSESKERDRWRLVMEIQVHRTLLSTGYFHTDEVHGRASQSRPRGSQRPQSLDLQNHCKGPGGAARSGCRPPEGDRRNQR